MKRLHLILLGLVVGLLGWFVPSVAAASDGSTAADLELSALTVTMLVSLVIPVVTGIITKFSTSSAVKGLVTLVLNGVNSIVVTATVADGTAVWSQETLIAAVLGLAISVSMYLGVYKPANFTSSTPDGRLANVGRRD